ncbi:MAG: AtpZ/AtpI family protein [Balneolaceae bacterium]
MIDDPRHKKYLEFIGLGLEIAVSLSFPILLGYWLDLKWDSSPLMLMAGVLLGLVFMIGLFSRVIRKMNNEP